MQKNMMYAHVMASLGSTGFYLDISKAAPELISADGSASLPLENLKAVQLLALKNLAHDQYVNGMLYGETDLSSHRATLNFLSRLIERVGHPSARPHDLPANRRARHASPRRAKRAA
jgi:hypothetical protein